EAALEESRVTLGRVGVELVADVLPLDVLLRQDPGRGGHGRVRDRAARVVVAGTGRAAGTVARLIDRLQAAGCGEAAVGAVEVLARVARTDPLEHVQRGVRAEGTDDQDVARRADVVHRIRIRFAALLQAAAQRDVAHLVGDRVSGLVHEGAAGTDRAGPVRLV